MKKQCTHTGKHTCVLPLERSIKALASRLIPFIQALISTSAFKVNCTPTRVKGSCTDDRVVFCSTKSTLVVRSILKSLLISLPALTVLLSMDPLSFKESSSFLLHILKPTPPIKQCLILVNTHQRSFSHLIYCLICLKTLCLFEILATNTTSFLNVFCNYF